MIIQETLKSSALEIPKELGTSLHKSPSKLLPRPDDIDDIIQNITHSLNLGNQEDGAVGKTGEHLKSALDIEDEITEEHEGT